MLLFLMLKNAEATDLVVLKGMLSLFNFIFTIHNRLPICLSIFLNVFVFHIINQIFMNIFVRYTLFKYANIVISQFIVKINDFNFSFPTFKVLLFFA